MRRFLTFAVFVLLAQLVFSGELYDFAYSFMIKQKVPENHARLMAKALEEESLKIPKVVDPLFMLAFGICETGFINAIGDNGKAVGYFQLHENALFYVTNFYEDVRKFKQENRNHLSLLNYPDWQLRIAYRYFYLSLKYIFDWDIVRAISAYNGRSDRYNVYTVKFFSNYGNIVREYTEFINSRKDTSDTSKTK